jgi:integrase/recombinase XerD
MTSNSPPRYGKRAKRLGRGAPRRRHRRCPVSPRQQRTGELDNTITPVGVYKLVRRYALALGLKIGARALRATAGTKALDHESDIAKVQEWLGHANIATTCIYDRRKMKPEDSPTFKVSY